MVKEFGFTAANLDKTLFVLKETEKGLYIMLCLYVDYVIAAENWALRFNKFLQFLVKHIKVTD